MDRMWTRKRAATWSLVNLLGPGGTLSALASFTHHLTFSNTKN
jgi:hypothetical protein